MEEDKVADMVANPPKKSTLTSKLTWKSNVVRELVTGAGELGPNFFDPKLT